MAIRDVGEARVLVRPIVPPSITRDIERNFRTLDRIGVRAGGRLGASFRRGFESMGSNGSLLGNTARGLRQIGVDGEAASRAFSNLSRAGQVIGPILGGIVGAVGALVGGLGALVGSAGGAAASLASIGAAGFTALAGLSAVRLALGGVGKSLQLLNRPSGGGGGGGGGGGSASNTAALAAAREAALRRVQDAEANLALTVERNRESLLDANNAVREAQLGLNAALKAGREEIQQLGFEAEDAALSEQRAALELEDARRALAAAQDLPPNSRVRQEAELAYREAELNYRKAKDSASDLAAEQQRLSRTGVAGTESVIRATEQLTQAESDREKAVRDALRAQIDAERDIADAKKAAATAQDKYDTGGASSGGGGGGVDPFAGLNAAQIQFVKNLQTLKPELEELKRVTAEALLPNLWEAIRIVMEDTGKVFPVLRDGLEGMAGAAGLAALSLARAVEESSNLADLQSSFAQAAPLFETFGRVAAEAWGVIITVIERTFPIAQRFFSFLEDKLRAFDEWMDTDQGKSSMESFLERSSDAMAQWGGIFGNIFAGFGQIINANLGPGTGGQLLLDWLTESTDKFANLEQTAGGSSALKDYFLGAAENTKAVAQALGALITEIVAVGDMPEIKQTWDILGEGADDLGLMLQQAVMVGPAFATVLATLAEIGGLLTDAATGIAFFSTLQAVLEPIRDFLAGPMVQAFLDFLAPITGVALAIGGLGIGAQVAFTIIAGYATRAIAPFMTLFSLFAANPILIALTAIVGAVIYLWNTSESFRDSMTQIFGQLSQIFGEVSASIVGIVSEALPPLIEAGQQIFNALMPVVEVLLVAFAQIATDLIGALAPVIPMLLDALVPAIVSLATAIVPVITTLADGLVPIITMIAETVGPVFAQILSTLVGIIGSLLQAIMPLVTTLVSQLAPIFIQIAEAILPVVMSAFDLLMPIITQLLDTFMPFITMLIDMLVPILVRVVEAIMPIVTTLADLLAPILDVVIQLFNAIVPPIMDLVSKLIEFLMPILTAVASFIAGVLVGALNFLVDVFKNFVIPIIVNVVNTIKNFFMPIIQAIVDVLGNVIGFLVNVFTGNWAAAWDNLVGIVRGVVNVIISVVESMINFVINGINGFLGALNEAGNFVSDVTGGAIDINVGKVGQVRIPRLAEGGTVRATPGGIMAVIGEAGRNERVEPLDKDGLSKRDYAMIEALVGQYGGGISIQVTQLPNENGEAFAQRVSEIISQKMRRGMA